MNSHNSRLHDSHSLEELYRPLEEPAGVASPAGSPAGKTWVSGTWAKENEARLRGMVSAGKCYREIAGALGVTRNAVIGKCNRMGLCVTRQKGPRPARPRPPRVRKPRKAAPVAPRPRTRPVEAISVGQVDIMGLTCMTCRWPLWDHAGEIFLRYGDVPFHRKFYCGAAVAVRGRPYCAEHTRKAFARGSGEARWG